MLSESSLIIIDNNEINAPDDIKNLYEVLFRENCLNSLLLDADTLTVKDVSQQMLNYCGRAYEDVIGRHVYDLIKMEHEDIENEIKTSVEEGRKYFVFRVQPVGEVMRRIKVYRQKLVLNSKNYVYCVIFDITAQGIMEDQFAKNELQLSAVNKLRNVGRWEYNLDTNQIVFSEEAKMIFGVHRSIFNDIELYSIVQSQYVPVLEKAKYDLVQKSIPFEVQYKINRENDKKVRVVHAIAEYHSETNVIVGILHDITDIKQAKSLSRQRKTLLNDMGRAAHVGGWEIDVSTEKISWTYEIAKIHDVEIWREFTIDEALKTFYPPDEQKVMKKAFVEMIKGRKSIDLTVRFISAKGIHKWVRMVANSKSVNGKVVKVMGSFQDVTKYKNAEDLIEKEITWRRVLMEQSCDGIAVLDTKGHILEMNPAFMEMLGLKAYKDSSEKICIWDRDVNVTKQHIFDMYQKAGEKGVLRETQYLRDDGTYIDIEINASLIEANGKQVILCICRDISQRKVEEHELITAKINAERANNVKNEFLSVMSHELRTPLTSVIGFSDVLLEGIVGELTERQQDYVLNISTSGIHLLQIINDILDMVSIETGEMTMYTELFDILEMVQNIVKRFQKKIDEKNINVRVECFDAVLICDGDRIHLQQVIENLLSNAIKFTQKEGNVDIKITHSESIVYLKIKDTGIGMTNNQMSGLFQPFKQLDSSLGRGYGGVGLGLALTKKFVEMHDGNIIVESEIDKGSIFTVSLPIFVK
jgi:PAS domain S-box-containing protein